MATFALVHGAWHGAWCWERLTPELEAHGHRVVTMDLPCEDGSLSFDDYAETVCAAVEGVDGEELVLVGHSLAGLTIPLVASRRPVRQMVYLCALLPIPGTSLAQQMSEDSEMLDPDYPKGLSAKDSEGRRTWIDKQLACHHMYGDCDDGTASAAVARIRPQATKPYRLPCSLAELPVVASTYVVCTEDRIVNPQWSRRIAHERLGADVVEMPGSHSPFLSRPKALAEVLDGVA
ncbi:alpha/beta hydrolase [Mycobacterium sp. ITM-2016-00318]|uniref:alpha/beta fold hydrolase n=1 Tax=Mycobacterium sp. ITM-2016-00318 TaxID=2099693 RepID=UPI00287FB054|nr:alpha/beta hydrolase [Mycobacterium sp. ITM-2016-00318]WNG92351.1 alpha/beta hydrolase [Mycobacterium sp. ITM-2016-00318]